MAKKDTDGGDVQVVSLETLPALNPQLAKRFTDKLSEATQNCAVVKNGKERTVTLKVTLKPNDNHTWVAVGGEVTSKLQEKPIASQMAMISGRGQKMLKFGDELSPEDDESGEA